MKSVREIMEESERLGKDIETLNILVVGLLVAWSCLIGSTITYYLTVHLGLR